MDTYDIIRGIDSIQSLDELRRISDVVRDRWSTLEKRSIASFGVGDLVEWDGKYGRVERGKIEKLNRKTASVRAETGTLWRIGASLLRSAS